MAYLPEVNDAQSVPVSTLREGQVGVVADLFCFLRV
jgi:hypothetical protein